MASTQTTEETKNGKAKAEAKTNGKTKAKAKAKEQGSKIDAEGLGDVMPEDEIPEDEQEALKEIANVANQLMESEEKLSATRKVWNENVAQAEARVRASIEADDDGSDKAGRNKLSVICEAYQEWVEAESGREAEVGVLNDRKKKLHKLLKTRLADAKQLNLKFAN